MGGFAQAGVAIHSGDNLAIQGVKPAGIAAQGNVVYRAAVPTSWQLLSHTAFAAPATASPAIDTTGAGLIVIHVSSSNSAPAISDSAGNSWAYAVSQGGGVSGASAAMYYCIKPKTSTTHTFSDVGADLHGAVVAAFKTPASIAIDKSTGALPATGGSVTLPAITPSANGSLIFSGNNGAATATIDSGFTVADATAGVTSQSWPAVAAYLSQGTAAAVTPTWSASYAAAMVDFVPLPNLLTNPGFENGLTGWGIGAGSPVIDSSVFHSGSASVSGIGFNVYQTFALTAGIIYTVQCWVKTAGNIITAGGSQGAGFFFNNTTAVNVLSSFGGVAVNQGGNYPGVILAATQATDWTLVGMTFQVTASGSYILNVNDSYGSYNTTSKVWLDDVFVG